MVKTIHFQNTFPFIYDIWESANVSSEFPDVGHNVNNFKARATVVVEFQILLHNFKASKKVDAVKAYLFQLLRIYLIDDLMHSTISTLNKR